MVINQSNLNTLLTGYSVLFKNAFSETQVKHPRIAMTVPSETKDVTYAWMGQMPNMREWVGSREIQSLEAHSYTIKNKTYELTTKIPVNDIADDQYGIYAPIMSEMGLSAKTHPDVLVFDLLGRGFSEKCYDGMPFFSDKHPLGKKATQSNKGTERLSTESYADARSLMMTIKGEQGKTLNIVPDLLVVSPQMEATARLILFSDLIAGSTNINKDTCELLVAPELTDYPNQWYLLCTKRYIKPLVFQQREVPKLVCKNKETDDNVFFDDEILYGIKGRYNVGFGLWQFAYGSTGEGTSSVG